MSRLRGLLPFHQPQEVTFFLFLSVFALVVTVIYWFASYEAAGTVLLLGFTLATGAMGVRLAMDPRAQEVRERAAAARPRGGPPPMPGSLRVGPAPARYAGGPPAARGPP